MRTRSRAWRRFACVLLALAWRCTRRFIGVPSDRSLHLSPASDTNDSQSEYVMLCPPTQSTKASLSARCSARAPLFLLAVIPKIFFEPAETYSATGTGIDIFACEHAIIKWLF